MSHTHQSTTHYSDSVTALQRENTSRGSTRITVINLRNHQFREVGRSRRHISSKRPL